MEDDRKKLNQKVQNVIEQVRPYLQADGGDINFIEITDDNVVNVELTGACGACPFSTMTLKNGVEATLKKVIPEIKEVVAINL
ncbi:NifU family protein [Candidatus Sulfidibacterium hydrothermale]|jgi:Fe-S cluster biogenesis protein NfuA|uniref:NifU family protein n=1 Tax=Candidatus Sulfidibacterium hydrothermale TaxID=2875962 RepID=UPI001F0A9689|nr:NifU family protein [Candidatus Sulfidibacterium hydrothermale]UBM62102.1 NifU family protein [Candidatus Sulfidibacterium hydrothermale]